MTTYSLFSMVLVMLALSAVPSASVAWVVTQSASFGIRHGIAASLGIAAGDLLFVLLALNGMHSLAENLGPLFLVIKSVGAIVLLVLGAQLIRKRKQSSSSSPGRMSSSRWTPFVTGFLITMGDAKALVFYATLFPVFVDLHTVTRAEMILIATITAVTVAAVKIVYAVFAVQISQRMQNPKWAQHGALLAGVVLMGAGVAILLG